MIPLETLRLGLRGDTLKEVLLGDASTFTLPDAAAVEAMSAEEILALVLARVPGHGLARLLLPEGGDGAARHALRARAEGARLRDRHALPLPGDVRALARGRAALRHEGRGVRGAEPEGSPRARESSGSASPTSTSRSRRSSRSTARSATSTAGSPASAATSRRRAPTRRSSAGTRRTSCGRRTRSPTGATSDCWAYIRERGLPYNALHDQRLRVDRRHPLDDARRRPRGPLGGHGPDRVRPARRGAAVVSIARRAARSRTSTSSRPRRSTSCARSPPSASGPCCSSRAARTRSCMLRLAEKAFRPAKFPFPVMHVDTGHNFPEVIEYRDRRVAELGERLVVASVQESIDNGRVVRSRPARARRATSCRRRRCSTRSRSTGSTRRWAARAATRSAPARRSASSASATTSASGTRARSAPSSGISTTRASARASTSACSRSRTGRSSTCGSTSPARTSSCRRSTSRTSATSSRATGCSTPPPTSSSASPTRSRSAPTVRFRTVGDMTCTGGVVSDAATIDEVVDEIAATRVTERGETRADDRVSRSRDGRQEARWLLLRSSSTPSCSASSPRARSTTASRR